MIDNNSCPICNSKKIEQKNTYSTSSLLAMWNVDFSNDVSTEHISQAIQTTLYKCKNCKFEFFYPIIYGTPAFYSELELKTNYYESDKWDFSIALQKALEIKGKILEIGSGPGNFLKKCNDNGIECYGTEYNDNAFEKAKKAGIKMIKSVDMNLYHNYFDAVFSFHVLEHVSNPMDFFEFHIKMIKKGGKICISVPNQDGPISYIDPCIMNMPPHHLTRWSLNSFKEAAKKLNLKIVDVKYEPLLLSNHSYYSYFFIKKYFFDKSTLMKKIGNYLNQWSVSFFEYLINKKKYKSFSLLNGMAIMVTFEK
jgi:2-polyprenyl-3-methyl-5-hydroxy-6-metoxy-1,4-benzoquinol methylase